MSQIIIKKISPINEVLYPLLKIIKDLNFRFFKDKIKIQTLCNERVSLFKIKLPKELFDEYKCDEKVSFKVDIISFINGISGNNLSIKLSDKLELTSDKETKLDYTKTDPFYSLDISHNCRVRINTQNMLEVIGKLKLQGEDISFTVYSDKIRFYNNDSNYSCFSSKLSVELEHLKDKYVSSKIDIKHINDYLNEIKNVARKFVLAVGDDQPVLIEYKIGCGVVSYYIAPIIFESKQ